MKQGTDRHGRHTIPAVNNALELVRMLAEEKDETTTKALAYRLGIPRTSCYRILRSLVERGWVRQTAGGRHELSLGLLPLLEPFRPMERLAEIVRPGLESLAQRAQLTAKVSVRQGDNAVTIERCDSPEATSVSVRVGAAFHLAYGSSGASLLSELDAADVKDILDRAPTECWALQKPADVHGRIRTLRAKGWCADLGTYQPGCHAISAPLRDAEMKIIAAMTLIGFPHELPKNRIVSLSTMLCETARRTQKELRRLSS